MSFADHFPATVCGRELRKSDPESLAALPYPEELECKNRALAAMLREEGLPEPAPVVPAPCPRHYRATGKRRITFRQGKVWLHFGRQPGKEPVSSSALEPEENDGIYRLIHRTLSSPRGHLAAQETNYCILRGTGKDRTLILNVRHLSGEIIRALRFTAESAAREFPSIRSAFLYVDESGSDYYLEAERPAGKMGWKKLFGPELLALRLAGDTRGKFLFPPTVFSQINESVIPVFAAALEQEFSPEGTEQLLDLYCGYGLWSLLLAERVRSVWGAELSPEAIRAARANAAHHFSGRDIRYLCGNITPEFLRSELPPPARQHELVLLDPPRHGPLSGVMEHLLSRRPRRILHVFCGTDEVPGALRLYRGNGCRICGIRPFDFFPGTMNLEVLAVVEPR